MYLLRSFLKPEIPLLLGLNKIDANNGRAKKTDQSRTH
ncbi:hypothetical protein Runsl_3236 [Runella slithyformis DSM 19594]|uniref:Uncharacterized protein n=1 Tax=Runella slithyformis (strain ATCC 29530 / DSM 19594 / LMG 11500 / NCIMB 11436 / LSU 4) TaxID=761193 RepID=A0A7U3ZM60_RUNSL|nr:hypothetical protein Runsl_3236 [Runella slithyformis DSM 19594]